MLSRMSALANDVEIVGKGKEKIIIFNKKYCRLRYNTKSVLKHEKK